MLSWELKSFIKTPKQRFKDAGWSSDCYQLWST